MKIRYRTLLSVSGLLAAELDVQAALDSVSVLLSKIIEFDRIALLLLNEDGENARLYALESSMAVADDLMGREFSVERHHLGARTR